MHTALDFGIGLLFVRFPFLDWWPLNALIRWILGNVEGDTWAAITKLINVYYVPFKNAQTQKIYAASILSLKEEALRSGPSSPAYLALRQQNAKDFATHVRSLLVPAV